MAERLVVMCDREDSNYSDRPCPSIAIGKCVVCLRDVCQQHTCSDSFVVRVESKTGFGYCEVGLICRQCGNMPATGTTRKALDELLTPLRDRIAEILRAQLSAEALK